MKSGAATARVLARSGQPRRRLARRRQHLPHPVMRARGSAETLAPVSLEDVREILVVPARVDLEERVMVDRLLGIDVETISPV